MSDEFNVWINKALKDKVEEQAKLIDKLTKDVMCAKEDEKNACDILAGIREAVGLKKNDGVSLLGHIQDMWGNIGVKVVGPGGVHTISTKEAASRLMGQEQTIRDLQREVERLARREKPDFSAVEGASADRTVVVDAYITELNIHFTPHSMMDWEAYAVFKYGSNFNLRVRVNLRTMDQVDAARLLFTGPTRRVKVAVYR